MQHVYPPKRPWEHLLTKKEIKNIFNTFCHTTNSPKRLQWLDFIMGLYSHYNLNADGIDWSQINDMAELFTPDNIIYFDTNYLWRAVLTIYKNTTRNNDNDNDEYKEILSTIISSIVSNTNYIRIGSEI